MKGKEREGKETGKKGRSMGRRETGKKKGRQRRGERGRRGEVVVGGGAAKEGREGGVNCFQEVRLINSVIG